MNVNQLIEILQQLQRDHEAGELEVIVGDHTDLNRAIRRITLLPQPPACYDGPLEAHVKLSGYTDMQPEPFQTFYVDTEADDDLSH